MGQMSEAIKEALRNEILVQIGVMQKIMEQIGIASINNTFLSEDGNAGLGGTIYLDKNGQTVDLGDHPVSGAAFPSVFLTRNGGVRRDLKPAVISLDEATFDLTENITDFIFETSGIEVINDIRLQLGQHELSIQIDISKSDHPEFRDWSFSEGTFLEQVKADPESQPAMEI
jgi:hypothetical protein